MFEDSLMESGGHIAAHPGWTTLLAISFQIVLLSALIALPLLHPEAIEPISRIIMPMPTLSRPPQSLPADHPVSANHQVAIPPARLLLQFHPLNRAIHLAQDAPAPPMITGVPCGRNCNPLNSNPLLTAGEAETGLARDVILSPQKPLRISSIQEGQILNLVQPAYPPLAKITRTEGQVLLTAIISKHGTVENLRVISGPPLLIDSALKAVSQWRFRPYLLNGAPVEVESQITVNFTLQP